jgi:uncharacterized protein YukE
MNVSPGQLRRAAAALHELSDALRHALAGDRGGPREPAWATDTALSAQAAAWDGDLAGLAARLADAGDRLVRAADGYAQADDRAGRRLC